jgi:diaminopimelate epimerase
MAVYERGVGVTHACGTGAVAAAAAARAWGLVGDDVVVRMPGGDVRVEHADGTTYLTTIVHDIAAVDFHWP